MQTHLRVGMFMIAVALVVAPALAASEPLPVAVPADSALGRGEHPRLLFRERDLPHYRARIAGVMKDDFQRFKSYWDGKIAQPGYDWTDEELVDGVALGVLYQLTGERRYADVVRRSSLFRKGSYFWCYSFALDLVFPALSKEEVDAQARLFLDGAEQTYHHRWGLISWSLWPALVFYGSGTGHDKEFGQWLAEAVPAAKQDIAEANEWAQNRGGDENSFSYLGNHRLIKLIASVYALSNALGQDSWEECTWLRHLDSYYVYHFMPWQHAAIHFDNTTGLNIGPVPRLSGDFGSAYLLWEAPARYRDGLYQWWGKRLLTEAHPIMLGGDSNSPEMAGLWGKILFFDPSLPELPPDRFPPSRFFPTRGFASMRENWGEEATFVHFRCGAWGNMADNRHHADNNTFTIYRKGILALDTGGAHALDAHWLRFDPPCDGPHNLAYASQTLAHNGVLVYHPVDDPVWKPGAQTNVFNTGGQMFRQPREWDEMRGVDLSGELQRRGTILAWETSPEYDYVAGDATLSYSPLSVSSFTRQLVYVRPDLIIVFDRVETARDGCRVTWLLHTADRPRLDGTETIDTRVHPEGHFLWDGSIFRVTDEEMGGRMLVKTLLPAKREVRLVGGKNHEFELPGEPGSPGDVYRFSDQQDQEYRRTIFAGLNPGPTAETYAMPLDAPEIRLSRALGEGLRGWRVEVEDRTGERSVRFLNVFQTGDEGIQEMAPCELVRRDGMVGARVDADGKTVEVMFRTEGKAGGAISIKADGSQVVARPLATSIEDSYDRWAGRQEYREWMTAPYRRSVVLGETPADAQITNARRV